jgi:hypothetical protein
MMEGDPLSLLGLQTCLSPMDHPICLEVVQYLYLQFLEQKCGILINNLHRYVN